VPVFEHCVHGQLLLGLLALLFGQFPLLLLQLGLFNLYLLRDGLFLAGRIAATLDTQFRFLEVCTDGVERDFRSRTQRHLTRLALETVAVAEMDTDTFHPGVHLAGKSGAVIQDAAMIGCGELQEHPFADGLRTTFPHDIPHKTDVTVGF
jgi:hypothetical protein